MVIGGNGKRFPVRALEFRVISATIRVQQMKSVYKVLSVAAPAEVAAKAGALFKLRFLGGEL